jgi:hypothetical protein
MYFTVRRNDPDRSRFTLELRSSDLDNGAPQVCQGGTGYSLFNDHGQVNALTAALFGELGTGAARLPPSRSALSQISGGPTVQLELDSYVD